MNQRKEGKSTIMRFFSIRTLIFFKMKDKMGDATMRINNDRESPICDGLFYFQIKPWLAPRLDR